MRSRSFGFLVLLISVLGFVRWQFSPSGSPEAGDVAATVKAKARAEVPVPASALEPQESVRAQTLARLAYAQGWNRELPPAMAAFRAWAARYRSAPDLASRIALEAEGVALARARRPEMLHVIKSDPQRALAITVPAVVRQSLPSAVLAELETRVAGRGDYMLRPAGDSLPGFEGARPSLRRLAFIGGVTYTAHAYGRREGQLTKEGASLHGVILDRQLALHESPLRVLEPGEIPATAAAAECPISNLAVAAPATGAGVNEAALNFIEADGRIFEFCDGEGMSDTLEGKLTAAENQPGPRVRAMSIGAGADDRPTTAAEAATSQTLGVKQVLVLRVDTSDFPGEPVTVAAAQAEMDNNVKPYLAAYSYGQTSTVGTVSPKVYRLPRTGASYALADEESALHADAITAAGADYNAANFDRVVVVHPLLSTSVVPGSLFA